MQLLNTLKLRLFALFKIPLIHFVTPSIVAITDTDCHVVVPLRFRTKNHIRTMYFGALSVGADLCIGLMAMHHIKQSGKNLTLIFKDFKIDFTKATKAHAHFFCHEGAKVKELIDKVVATGERQSAPISGYTTTPSVNGDEHTSEFTLTLSVK